MLSVQTIIISLLFLIILPSLAGYGFCKKLSLFQTFYGWYLTGCLLLWASAEFILVPFVYFQATFFCACTLVLLLYAGMAVYGLKSYTASNKTCWNPLTRIRSRIKHTDRGSLILLGVTALITVMVTVLFFFLPNPGKGDVHYIVSAVDMLKNDRLFLSDSASGRILDHIPGIYSADLVSPWSFTYTFLAFAGRVSPLVAAHRILPVSLILLCSCIYLSISEVFFQKSNRYRMLFIVMIWALQVMGFYSWYSASAQLLTRIWQGPAIVASIGIPMALYFLLNIYAQPLSKKYWLLLVLSDLSLCFMDRSGVILAILLILSFCTCYSLYFRNIWIAIYGSAICSVNVIYWVLADSVLNGIHFTGNPSAAEILQHLSNIVNVYYGDGKLIVLGLLCGIILNVISSKNSQRLLYPLLVILVLIFYPYFYQMATAGFSPWQTFWLFPEYLLIGITLTKFIEKAKDRKHKIVGLMLIAVLFLVSGSIPKINEKGLRQSNLEKINPSHKKIYDYILARDAVPSCIMRDGLLYEARQYDPDFVLPYSLNQDGSVSMIDMHFSSLPHLMEVPFLGTFRISRMARDHDINYIVVDVRDHMRLGLLHHARYRLLTRIGNDLIYCRLTPAEYRLQRENLARLNLKNRANRIISAVRKLDDEKLDKILSEAEEQAENDPATNGQSLPSENSTEDKSGDHPDEDTEDSGDQEDDNDSGEEESTEGSDEEESSENSGGEESSEDSGEEDTAGDSEEEESTEGSGNEE